MSELFPDSDVRAYPFPEAVQRDDEQWTIIEGRPAADFGRNLLSVPLKDDPISHNVRVHMQGKIRWSSELGGLKIRAGKDTIEAVDGMRITHLIQRRAKIDTSLGYMRDKEVADYYERFIEQSDIRLMVLFALNHQRTKLFPILQDMLIAADTRDTTMVKDILDETARIMEERSFLNNTDLKEVAEHVEKRIAQAQLPPEPDKPQEDPPDIDDEILEDMDEMHNEGIDEILQKLMRQEFRIDRDYNEWGNLVWETPPLPNVVQPRMVQRKLKYSEDGIILRDITRLWTDGKIWAKHSRTKGGGVLIDCSSSMSFTNKQIEELVRAAPAVSIALYSGDGDRGVIREVVRHSRMCASSLLNAPGGGFNIVDGPCIEQWLARQSHPRIWISDGWVNGKGGNTAQNLFDDAMDLLKKYGIIRVNHINAAMKLFERLERGGGMVHPSMIHTQNKDIELMKNI